MSEKSFAKKVHVVVKPTFKTDFDSVNEYYVSLQMNPLECQLTGDNFVRAARKALHKVLDKDGKVCVYNDGKSSPSSAERNPGDSQSFMFQMVGPEEIILTSVRRLASPDGKSLTEFSYDTTINHTST